MSHFTEVKTEFKDLKMLEKAAKDLGHTLQIDANGNLEYQGYYSEQKGKCHAMFALPKKGGRKQHLAFIKQDDGSYKAIADWYGTDVREKDFMGKLTQRYSYHKIKKEARKNNYAISEKTLENGTLRLELKRW